MSKYRIQERPDGRFIVSILFFETRIVKTGFFKKEKKIFQQWRSFSESGQLANHIGLAATFCSIEEAEKFIKRKDHPIEKFI